MGPAVPLNLLSWLLFRVPSRSGEDRAFFASKLFIKNRNKAALSAKKRKLVLSNLS